ncbi:hypothetical protein [Chryseobacterium sp. 2R14A]
MKKTIFNLSLLALFFSFSGNAQQHPDKIKKKSQVEKIWYYPTIDAIN